MNQSSVNEPWLEERIEKAIAPYRGRLPAKDLSWIREQLMYVLMHDETAAKLMRGAHPREVDESGEQAQPGVVAQEVGDDRGRRRVKAG